MIFMTVRIEKTKILNTIYKENGIENDSLSTVTCWFCGNLLTQPYVTILNKLREHGLLPKNEKYLCCPCHRIKKCVDISDEIQIDRDIVLLVKDGVIIKTFFSRTVKNKIGEHRHKVVFDPTLEKLKELIF